jgi:bacteriocin-like protein
MNTTEIRELNDAELETVSGGMDCNTAKVVADIHRLTATALEGLGRGCYAAFFGGKAAGIEQGGCL